MINQDDNLWRGNHESVIQESYTMNSARTN